MDPKSNTFEKHVGKRIAKQDLPHIEVKKNGVYINKKCHHLQNAANFHKQRLNHPTILEQVLCS
jgi:hypothetical protein